MYIKWDYFLFLGMANQQSPKKLTITNVNPTLVNELNNIADQLGIPLASFLKPKLKDIADSYSKEMKEPKTKR